MGDKNVRSKNKEMLFRSNIFLPKSKKNEQLLALEQTKVVKIMDTLFAEKDVKNWIKCAKINFRVGSMDHFANSLRVHNLIFSQQWSATYWVTKLSENKKCKYQSDPRLSKFY